MYQNVKTRHLCTWQFGPCSFIVSAVHLAVASSKMLIWAAKLDASEKLTSTTGCRGRDADLTVLGQEPHHWGTPPPYLLLSQHKSSKLWVELAKIWPCLFTSKTGCLVCHVLNITKGENSFECTHFSTSTEKLDESFELPASDES